MGFHPMAVVGKLVKNMKETAVYKIRNNTEYTKYKTNIQNVL